MFLVLLLYDGSIRKWILPQYQQIVFIVKDVFLFLVFIYAVAFIRRSDNVQILPVIKIFLVLYISWVLLEAGNLALPSILVGIWGVKAHLLHMGLIVLVPIAFMNLNNLLSQLVRLYPFIVIPVCVIAFFQVISPADSFINQTVTGFESIAYFGERHLVRVFGTFSYITGMASFLQVTILLGVGLFLLGVRSHLFLISLGFVISALPVTGSRAVIVISAVSIFIMSMMAVVCRLTQLAQLLRITALLGLLLIISFYIQDQSWVALQQRTLGGNVDNYRMITAFTNAFHYFDVSGLIGFGSGSANLGSPAFVRHLYPFSWLPVGGHFEEESGRIVLELGIIGWMISLAMRIALFFWSVFLAMTGGKRIVRAASVLTVPIMAYGVHSGSGVFFHPVLSSYYWFCVALLIIAQYEHQSIISRRRMRDVPEVDSQGLVR